MQWEYGSYPPELFTTKGSLKPNLKVPRFVLIFLQNASNQQASLKTWNFHGNQVGLFRRNNIFCQQRCCRKYNRRTHRHSRIRAKMCRKRGNTFKYFCPWLLNLLNRICILLIDTLQKLYLQHTPDQDSIPASCLCRGALLDWSETVPAKCLLLSIKYGLSFQREITAQSAKCCKHFPARRFRS